MPGVFTVSQIRAAEQAAAESLPAGQLMQRASAGLAAHCVTLLGGVYGAEVSLLVGAGGNGGDTLHAGARLARRGARVQALLLAPARTDPEGIAALCAAGGRCVAAEPELLARADLVVDGMVGIGGSGGLRETAARLATAAESVLTVGVDIPSGVDAQTGEVSTAAVRADHTVTFGALKTGLMLDPGAEFVGELHLIDIGLGPYLPAAPAWVVSSAQVAAFLPRPSSRDDKYRRGVVGVIAGSAKYPGAAVLATGAALRGGAGMVRYLGTAPTAVQAHHPEVVIESGARPAAANVQAWVVGPGMGTDQPAFELLAEVLQTDVPVVIDADAITLLAQRPQLLSGRRAATVLTPHAGEFLRIAGQIGADRLAAARRAAAELHATVLLKGAATIVADPDGQAFINATGTGWLATAGSGDVLSGLLGSLLAAGLQGSLAAACAAHIHGVAGQLAATEGPVAASEILAALRPAVRRVTSALAI